MTTEEAIAAKGQPFRWLADGVHWWDIITDVKDGWVIGNFFDAPAHDCRLKNEIPEGLKKYKENQENK